MPTTRHFMINVDPQSEIDWDALLASADDDPTPRTVRRHSVGFLELERQVRALADKLMPDGSKLRSFDGEFVTANYAYRCDDPFAVDKIGVWDPIATAVKGHNWLERDGLWYAKLPVKGLRELLPCRKCDGCLERNKASWFMRAREEFYLNQCTWMATFTMAPLERALLEKRAIALFHKEMRKSVTSKREYLDRMERDADGRWRPNRGELLRCCIRVFGRMVTTWLRSVTRRGRPKGEPRILAKDRPYVLVAELHQDGNVHFHAIFHERRHGVLFGLQDGEWRTEAGNAMSTEHLIGAQLLGVAPAVTNFYAKDDCRARRLWRFGHTKFRLLRSEKDLNYVIRYFDAVPGVRTQASAHYGKYLEPVDLAPAPFQLPPGPQIEASAAWFVQPAPRVEDADDVVDAGDPASRHQDAAEQTV